MNKATAVTDDLIKRKLQIEEKKKESERLLAKYKYAPTIPKQTFNKTTKGMSILPQIASLKKKKYNVTFIKKKDSNAIDNNKKETQTDNINQITFSKYLQIQTLAEMNIKPGRNMTEKLLNHIDKIGVIRKRVMEREIEAIMSIKGRYNDENPEEDTKIELEDKALIEHKWKNSFYLSEYQNFFLDELKGKISSLNYRAMLKKFRQIARMCFSKGTVNLGNINHMLNQEY